jgi:hypothetical protein
MKRFRTEESARKHAKRVLGLLDESALSSRIAIVPVSKNAPAEQPGERGTA